MFWLPCRLSGHNAVTTERSTENFLRTGTSAPRSTWDATTYDSEMPMPPTTRMAATASLKSATLPAFGVRSTARPPIWNSQRKAWPTL